MSRVSIRDIIFSALIGFSNLVSADINKGLVAYYPFNGTANDESGNGNHGKAIGGVQYIAGRVGQAASFDGIDDYIEIPMNEGLSQYGSTSLSVSAWINPKSFCSGVVGARPFWVMHCSWTSFGQMDFYVGTNSKWTFVKSGLSMPEEWHHWVGVYDGKKLTIYLDGKLNKAIKLSGSIDNGSQDGNEDWMIFGKNYHPSYSNDRGRLFSEVELDEVRIYERVLSAIEVQELYNEGSSPNEGNIDFSFSAETDQPYSGINCEASYDNQSQILSTPCLKIIGSNVTTDTFYSVLMKLTGNNNSTLEFQIDGSSINEIQKSKIETDKKCLPTFNVDSSELTYKCLFYSPDSINISRFNTSLNVDLKNGKSYVKSEKIIEVDSLETELSVFQETSLYKAIQNKYHYRDPYNREALVNDKRRRLMLWVWESMLRPKFYLESEIATQNINDIEVSRDLIKQGLDIADALVSVTSMAKDIRKLTQNKHGVPILYKISQTAGLATEGCSLAVKFGDAVGVEQGLELTECSPILNVLNQNNNPNTVIDAVNPIAESFIPKLIPALMESFIINKGLHKIKVSKPNPVEMAISIAKIANDFTGAYRASLTNNEITSRLVAQLWLDAKFRSAGDRIHMSRLISRLQAPSVALNSQNVNLTNMYDQIEVIALSVGSTGATCDLVDFYSFGFANCDKLDSEYQANYDKELVVKIISNYLSQANNTYRDLRSIVDDLEK